MADEIVSIRIRLSGGKEAAAEAKLVSTEIKGVGTASVEASAASRAAGGRMAGITSKLRGAWSGIKRIAKVAAVGLAGGAIAVGIWGKHAISNTADLAKATIGLRENLGLGVEQGSALLSLAKVRGADATKFGMAMNTIAKQAKAAATGSTTAEGAFRKLGISQKEVEVGSHHFGQLLGDISEGFENTAKGTTRQALASKLFGKGYAQVFPLFREGRQALHENIAEAKSFGAVLTATGAKNMGDFVTAQRRMELAMIGFQIVFSEKVVPWLLKGINIVGRWIREWRKGKGPIHDVFQALKPLAEAIKNVVVWLVKHPEVIEAVVAAYVAWTVATTALTVATTALAIAASPVTLIMLAVIALGVAFFIAYKKIKWFRNGVDAIFSFVKKNWQVLIIPISPILVVWITIYKVIKANVGRIKGVVFAMKDAIVGAFNAVVGFFKGLPGKIAGALAGVGKKIAAPFIWAWEKVKAVIDKINEVKDKLTGGVVGKVLGAAGDVAGFAGSLIPGGQHGIRSFPGGLAVVGEAGPELVSLPRGTDVIPNRESKRVVFGGEQFRRPRREIRQPVQLNLDGRVLTETVIAIQDDADARQ